MNRAKDLKEDEDCTDEQERDCEGIAAVHGADKNTHRDGERRRQRAPEQQGQPPGEGKPRSCLGQGGEKLPFLAFEHPLEHDPHCALKNAVCA